MEIKLKLRDILPLEILGPEVLTIQLPGQYAYRLMKIMRQIRQELDEFSSVRAELYKKHGATNPDGSMTVPPEKYPEYNVDMDPILEEEVVITTAELFPVSILDTVPSIKVSLLMAIEWLFE